MNSHLLNLVLFWIQQANQYVDVFLKSCETLKLLQEVKLADGLSSFCTHLHTVEPL